MSPDPADLQKFLVSEWQESRNVVSKLDSQLSGLRQFGFSFVTVLLVASSVIFQTAVGPTIKLAVILATFGLVLALYATDCFYRIIQSSAAHKSKMLEASLGDEQGLTAVIGYAYGMTGDWIFIEVLYVIFLVATAGLGLAALPFLSWQSVGMLSGLLYALALLSLMDSRTETADDEKKKRFPVSTTSES